MRLSELTQIVLKELVLDAWVRQINHEVSDNYVMAIELVAKSNGIDINKLMPEDILSAQIPKCKYL